ncbi:MAG TPA: response regulator [Acidobacteriaceae bacterium]
MADLHACVTHPFPGSGIPHRMIRPCYLVVDREHAGSISTRKLLIESAKFNVITAYSAQEAIETLDTFPAVDGVVVDANMNDISTPDLIRAMKHRHPAMPVVIVGTPGGIAADGADYGVELFEPRQLLDLLRLLHPEKSDAIAQREQNLESRRE